jgi:hypothetical protein
MKNTQELFVDSCHLLSSCERNINSVSQSADSVDFLLFNLCQPVNSLVDSFLRRVWDGFATAVFYTGIVLGCIVSGTWCFMSPKPLKDMVGMKTVREILLYLIVILVGGWLVVFQSARQIEGETAAAVPITIPTTAPDLTPAPMQVTGDPQNMVTCNTSLWVVDKDETGAPRYTLYCDGELIIFESTTAVVAVSAAE